jgi:hypothetical protein
MGVRRWRLGVISWALPLVLACSSSAVAQTDLEYQVKAAFLLNFAKFVEWPPNAFANSDSPLTICILGKDPFGRTIDDLVQGEAANGRKLMVRRMSQPPAPQACHVVFAEGSTKESAKTLSALGPGVLIVGEGGSFLRDGGMIAFPFFRSSHLAVTD